MSGRVSRLSRSIARPAGRQLRTGAARDVAVVVGIDGPWLRCRGRQCQPRGAPGPRTGLAAVYRARSARISLTRRRQRTPSCLARSAARARLLVREQLRQAAQVLPFSACLPRSAAQQAGAAVDHVAAVFGHFQHGSGAGLGVTAGRGAAGRATVPSSRAAAGPWQCVEGRQEEGRMSAWGAYAAVVAISYPSCTWLRPETSAGKPPRRTRRPAAQERHRPAARRPAATGASVRVYAFSSSPADSRCAWC